MRQECDWLPIVIQWWRDAYCAELRASRYLPLSWAMIREDMTKQAIENWLPGK